MTKNEIFKQLKIGSVISVGIDNVTMISGYIVDMCHLEPMRQEEYYIFTICYKNMLFELDSRDVVVNLWIEDTEDGQVLHDEMAKRIKEEQKELLLKYGFKEDAGLGNIMPTMIEKWDECSEEEKEDYLSILEKFKFNELMEDVIQAMANDKKYKEELHDWKIQKLDDEIAFLEKYENLKKFLPKLDCKLYDAIIYDVCGLKIG